MCSFRLGIAVFALAITAGSAAAQVADSLPSSNKPAVAADPAAVPTQANPQPDAPPAHVSPVPEPGSILLLAGPAAVGWVAYWRRKWRADPTNAGPATQP
jgi:PEP-CTERM motif